MGTECSISDLPGEILAHIFSIYVNSEGFCELLKNISIVCKQWNEVCKSPCLFKCVDDPKLTTEQMIALSKAGLLRNTTNLNLSNIQIWPECYEHLFQIIENCDNLQSLDMSRIMVMEQMASFIAQTCKKLKSLKLDSIHLYCLYFLPENPEKEALNREVDPFIQFCGRNLVHFSLAGIILPICNNILSKIPNECHNLEELYILPLVEKLSMSVSEFQKGCPKLRVLNISNCKFDCLGASATNGFPHLEVFVGKSCTELEDEDLYCLLRNSPNLHTLGVNDSRVSCESLLKIPAQNIQRLYVSKTSAIHSYDFSRVISRWKLALKELNICQINDEHRIKIALTSLWKNNFCPRLEVLNLSTSDITVSLLKLLLYKCKHLRYLDVTCCHRLLRRRRKIYKTSEEIERLKFKLRKFLKKLK